MTKYDRLIDKAFSWIEVGLALLWIYGGFNSFFADPFNTASPIYDLLAGQAAIYFYAVLFFATGVSLLYAKYFKKKRLKGWTLTVMYLTCVYVLILSTLLQGLDAGLTLTVVAGILSGWAWLRWRLRTGYIDPDEFADDVNEHRDDLPPTPPKD